MNPIEQLQNRIREGCEEFQRNVAKTVAFVQQTQRSQPRPQDVLMLAGSVVGATVAQVQSMTRPPVGPLPLPLASISFSNPFMQHSTQRRSCKSQEVLGELAGAAESTPGGVPAPSAPSTAPTTSASTPTSTQGDTGSASLRGPASDPTAPTPTSSSASSSSSSGAAGPVSDGRVLVSEIDVAGPGVTEEMRQVALRQLQARPNYAYTDREILSELERLVDTGYFQAGRIVTDDTRDGVKLTFQMVPWKEVKSVVVSGSTKLPSEFLEDLFKPQYGKVLNTREMSRACTELRNWYNERGYIADVIDIDQDSRGTVNIQVTEALVNKVVLKFNKGNGESSQKGKTKPEVLLRHLTNKPGQLYNAKEAEQAERSIYSTGLYDDVNITPTINNTDQPAPFNLATQQPKIDLVLNVTERKTGGLSAGGGISATGSMTDQPGLLGHVSYTERNLFGSHQRLTLSAELGQSESLFRFHHLDPWVGTNRTSRSITIMNTKNPLGAIHGAAVDAGPDATAADVAARDANTRGELFMSRELGTVEWTRPLDNEWSATWGMTVQRTRCLDEQGTPRLQDQYDVPLTFSGKLADWAVIASGRAVYAPSEGESIVLSAEKAFPLPAFSPTFHSLNFARFRARGETKINLGKGVHLVGSAKAGTVIGDLPPYEAFPIGGSSSVRGWNEGAVGTGRHSLVLTAEARVPLVSSVTGAVFADFGSDLKSGESVTGDPAGARSKPGSGMGFGAGFRFDSPVGPLRLEYAVNNNGKGRFHFGVGNPI